MSKSDVPESKPFFLEICDRSDDELSKGNKKERKGYDSDDGRPMDTKFSEDAQNEKRQIRINLKVVRYALLLKSCSYISWNSRGMLENALWSFLNRELVRSETPKGKRFDMETLFAAVSRGDVSQLHGLDEYLRVSMKHLTDSDYEAHGKNALIKGLLNLEDGRNDTVEFLLDIAEKMGDLEKFVNAAYTDSYYKGQTALHVAVERRSKYFVKLLVQKGANVHAKACGKFFQAHDGPNFYFGELPLSLAACTNQLDIVDYLIDNPYQKVDITKVDSQGNTVLHALVLVADNSKENTEFITRMYDHILITAAKLYPDTKLEDIENRQRLTPLKLAAKTGKIGLFNHIMHREFHNKEFKHLSRKFTEWVYGPVKSSLYDMTSVDSYETNSVMEIIVYGSTIPNRLEMLQVEPLNSLLNAKWDRFARWIFLARFIFYILYLTIFTTVAYNRRDVTPPFPMKTTEDKLYFMGQLFCTLGAVYFFFRGMLDLWRRCPKLRTLLVDGYNDLLFFLQAVLFIISALLYCHERPSYLAFMVVCLALSWVNLLYFSRGSRHMGIYSVMIQKMILGDILRFIFVYLVYLFGFSAAVVTLIEEIPSNSTNMSVPESNSDCKKPTYNNLNFTTLELFKFTIGMGDLEFTEQFRYKEVFYLLLISYIILTYILLLNMLIALMSRTVEELSEESLNIWKLQRAITILDLERHLTLFPFLRTRLRCGVEKDLGKKPKTDKRWCFSMEEVNWNKWSNDLGIVNEEPGNQETSVVSSADSGMGRESGWRRMLSVRATKADEPQENEPMMNSLV